MNGYKPIPLQDMTAEQWDSMYRDLRAICILARQIARLEDMVEAVDKQHEIVSITSARRYADLVAYKNQSTVFAERISRLNAIIDSKRKLCHELLSIAVCVMPDRPAVEVDGLLFKLSFWGANSHINYTVSVTSTRGEAIRIHG